MLNEIIRFVQEYPRLFVFIIVDILNIIVFFREILRTKERLDKHKMIILILHAIVVIVSTILLVILISLKESII